MNQVHEDYQGLQLAYEAMVDVADYTNECTRDREMCQIINDVQVQTDDTALRQKDHINVFLLGEYIGLEYDGVFRFNRIWKACKRWRA